MSSILLWDFTPPTPSLRYFRFGQKAGQSPARSARADMRLREMFQLYSDLLAVLLLHINIIYIGCNMGQLVGGGLGQLGRGGLGVARAVRGETKERAYHQGNGKF